MAVEKGNASVLSKLETLKQEIQELKGKLRGMYIKTEEDKIINFDHYRSIEVYPGQDAYVLRAITSMYYEKRSGCDDIAIFDQEVDASYALVDFFNALTNGKHTWDVSNVKSLSIAWSRVKVDNESLPILERSEISVIGLGKFVIRHPSKCRTDYDLNDQKKTVESELITALNQEIEICWKPCDELNSNA